LRGNGDRRLTRRAAPWRRQLSGDAHQCQPVQAGEVPCLRVEEQHGDEGKHGDGVLGPGHGQRRSATGAPLVVVAAAWVLQRLSAAGGA
jgi:hypothetical protein